MDSTVVVGLLAFFGTLIGTIGGIITSNRLTNYKIEILTKKVEEHNNLIKRMFKVEERCTVLEKMNGIENKEE
jgi:hypothetical protein